MKKDKLGVELIDLISAGLISPPIEIRALYLGSEFKATITEDGMVCFKEQTYPSVSSAAVKAKELVTKPSADSSTLSTNGWLFWKYYHKSDHKWFYLRQLRSQYLESRG